MQKISRRKFIQKSAITGTIIGLGCNSGLADKVKVYDKEFDIIIKNGTVIDGTGKKTFSADIAIKDDRISKIVPAIPASAGKKIIDASGLIVCPGFVDIHTHSKSGVTSYCYVHQGVTTEIGGNCGSTVTPRKTKNGKDSISDELAWYDSNKFLTNFGTLVGHAPIRNFAMGLKSRIATLDEIKIMQAELAESLEKGAFGLSSGLEYAPGCFSDENEMIQLARIIKKYDAIYTTHMRNEQQGVFDSVLETIRVAKAADIRVEVSHLKMSRVKAWHLADKVLDAITKARNEGLDIGCDKYPYTAWSTALSVLFPDWSKAGDSALLGQNSNLLRRLKDKSLDKKLRADIEKMLVSMAGTENIVIDGKSLKEICQKRNLSPYDAMKTILLETNGTAGVIGFSMTEENTEKLLAYPLLAVASDGHGQPMDKHSLSHPRSFGTFPRVLGRYVRDRKIMSLPEAIRKMTSLPAQHFRIKDRGLLEKGKFADITIFDYDNIIDTATFEKANQKPKGIEYVLVNGKVTIEKGQLTNNRAGHLLRKV